MFNFQAIVPFFSDIGWFYQSALQNYSAHTLPILGITSSVKFLHQGPLWTYFLIPVLKIFSWHPFAPVLISVFFYWLAAFSAYWVARIYFSRQTGVLAAIAFILSPLLIVYGLTPFSTAPIPAFTLLVLLFLARKKYFQAFLFLGFLYQLEKISLVLWPVFIFYLYGQNWRFKMTDILGFCLGCLPVILAGPLEFFGPFVFAIFKIFRFVTTNPSGPFFYLDLIAKLLIPSVPFLSLIVLIASLFYLLLRKNLFVFWVIVPALAIIVSQTPSEAYFIQILPFLLLSMVSLLARLLTSLKLTVIYSIVFIMASIHILTATGFMLGFSGYGLSLQQKIDLVRHLGYYPQVLTIIGPGQEFPSVTDPYQYLFWYYYQNPTPRSSATINEYTQMLQ